MLHQRPSGRASSCLHCGAVPIYRKKSYFYKADKMRRQIILKHKSGIQRPLIVAGYQSVVANPRIILGLSWR